MRRWVYSYLLGAPLLLLPCFSRGVTRLERLERLIGPLVLQAVRPLIRRGYAVDEATGRASLARCGGNGADLCVACRWSALSGG